MDLTRDRGAFFFVVLRVIDRTIAAPPLAPPLQSLRHLLQLLLQTVGPLESLGVTVAEERLRGPGVLADQAQRGAVERAR